MTNLQTILIVAAHPDDEVLGCGGTIARMSSDGNRVHILLLAEGLTSRQEHRSPDNIVSELSDLHEVAQKAGKLLGAQSVQLLGFPDNRMDGIDLLDIIKKIEHYSLKISPDVVFTHNPFDLNIDHRLTAEAVITVFRPQPGRNVSEICFFEVASSTEWRIGSGFQGFQPNYFVPLGSDDLEKKMNALELYSNEMQKFPHARSGEAVKHLNHWRGATIGKEIAEAFVAYRIIR